MKTTGIIAAVILSLAIVQEKSLLDIEISHVRNGHGEILLSLYTSADQYPYHPMKTYVVKKDSLKNGQLRTVISDLNPGLYGLCLLDDENRSGQMENNRLGLPVEGYGFANNVKPFVKRPDFDRVQFRLQPGTNHIQLVVRYKTQ